MNRYIRRRRHTKRKDSQRAGLLAMAAGIVLAGTVTAAGYYGFTHSQGNGRGGMASPAQAEAVQTESVSVVQLAGDSRETETTVLETEPTTLEMESTIPETTIPETEPTGSEAESTVHETEKGSLAAEPRKLEKGLKLDGRLVLAEAGLKCGLRAGADTLQELGAPMERIQSAMKPRKTGQTLAEGEKQSGADQPQAADQTQAGQTEAGTGLLYAGGEPAADTSGSGVSGSGTAGTGGAQPGGSGSDSAPSAGKTTGKSSRPESTQGAQNPPSGQTSSAVTPESTTAAPTTSSKAPAQPESPPTPAQPESTQSPAQPEPTGAPAQPPSTGASEPTSPAETQPSQDSQTSPQPPAQTAPGEGQAKLTAAQKLQSMTLEQKVAQMFVVTPEELTGGSRVTSSGAAVQNSLQRYPVGGIIYFSNNLVSQGQTAQMTAQIQQYAQQIEGLPLFVAADEEGGARSTIAGKSGMGIAPTSSIAAIGSTQDASQAYGIGSYIGQYMHGLGFNMNLAPVADVLTNPNNDVIQGRSFGSDTANVSAMTQQMLNGLKDQSVYGVLKHFPGHGSTDGGRVNGFPYTSKTLEELMQSEMAPFKQAIDQGAVFIMAGHIAAPAVTGDQTPCSLSKTLITDVLRGQLGYQGIVVTDALNTPAVQRAYGTGQACVMAVQAGADLLLMPKNFHSSYDTVLQAVQNGTISEERINQSVERILTVKMNMQ